LNKMLKRNNFIIGLLAGLVLPALAWFFFGCLFPAWVFMDKPLIPYFVAIGLNLLFIRLCYTKDAGNTATGVMIATFIIMLVLFAYKIKAGI